MDLELVRFMESLLGLADRALGPEPQVWLTLTRNLTLTLRSSIKSKSKKSSAESEAGVILTTRFMDRRRVRTE